jgi:putative ABC transport system ATP-binding protein
MMIELNHVVPHPLPKQVIQSSDVWNTKLCFKPNSTCLVSAQSGMGKSTLLHFLYGVRKDFSGILSIDGKDSSSLSREDWIKIRKTSISLLFQDLRLFSHLTALENINLIPVANPQAPAVEEMADQLGIMDLLDQSVATLSHGQRQRVALVRALRKPFQFLLLDEPFSHLDEVNQNKACSLITQLVQINGASLILSTLGSVPEIQFDQTYSL